jgi:hypothetical protein
VQVELRTVSGCTRVTLGEFELSTGNRVVVAGGTLRATAADGAGFLDVRRGTNVLQAGLVDVDRLVLANKSTPTIDVFTGGFGNADSITTPIASGSATPYPSTIAVAGVTGIVTKVTVTLPALSHNSPIELDILLVGPAGQKVMLMSDAGSIFDVSGVSLTFDDSAPGLIPFDSQMSGGIYRPTDYESGDIMPAPAPAGPYSNALSRNDAVEREPPIGN